MTTIDGTSKRDRLRLGLDIIATVSMVVAAATIVVVFLWRPGQEGRAAAPVPTEPISLAGAPRLGSPASVVLLQFSDFQCPFCGRFATTVWPELKRDYVESGRVQAAFRHLPLVKIHPDAWRAAEAAECAHQQGRFWDMHDLLFADPTDLSQASINRRAVTLSLDAKVFVGCLQGAATERVKQDAAAAARLNITGTPAFVVGRLGSDGQLLPVAVLRGAQPVAEFRKALDSALAASKG